MKDLLLIPNILTISRILLIAPSLYLLDIGKIYIASVIITILFLTDFFDGYLARKLEQTSFIGAILDPISDKIVVLSFFTYLFLLHKVHIIYFLLILIRDIAQLTSIPVLIFWKKIIFKVKPKLIPKWGTALNFILLGIISFQFFKPPISENFIYNLALNIVMIISGLIEIYILVTFIPRFYQIYKGTHDTFE
ncbi:MAG: CDP-alcohol phosphatidyltransferase family protein [Leptospiraceae bacterium]|nr:CDP-alcohol phosphatidyltransferase family protein [Leptospiraceae bacterium]